MTASARKPHNIGQTPLLSDHAVGRPFGLPTVFIKNESANPTGTVKDRRSAFVLQEAERLRVDTLVLITSGNNGFSLGTLARGTDVRVVCLVDRSLQESIKRRLQSVASQLIEVNLQHKILRPEEVISFAREREDEVIWDVTNGYEESYVPLVAELLKTKPDYIVTPIGSGEIFLGLVQGVDQYKLPTKVIGVGVQNTLKSYADKLHTPWTPYARALEAMEKRGHVIFRLDEAEIKATYTKYRHVVPCEPSSAVVFAALRKFPFKSTDRVVFVNSGRMNHT